MQMARGKKIVQVDVDDVEKRRHPGKHYVYIITVTWSDGNVSVIYRRYSKFFDFQIKLLDIFPKEAGKNSPSERIIPFLPGKIIFGRSHIREVAIRRLEHINKYCKELIKLSPHISESEHVSKFFEPTIEDLVPTKSRTPKKSVIHAKSISEPVLLEQYVVIVEYAKEGSIEISLHAGELVEVIEKNETGWWFVSGEEGQGWVPSSYLEKPDGEEDNTAMDSPGESDRPHLATQGHTPEFPDELKLDRGDVVEVLQMNLDGWWEVRSKGKKGLVPGSYLTRTDTVRANRIRDAMKPDQQRSKDISRDRQDPGHANAGGQQRASPALNSPQNKVRNNPLLKLNTPTPGVAAGNKDAGEKKSLFTTTGSRPKLPPHLQSKVDRHGKSSQPSPSLASASSDDDSMLVYSKPPPPRRRSVKKLERMSSLYPPSETEEAEEPVYMTIADFTNHAGDGISFREGATVQVLDKHENGWWYVDISGEQGWVPSQYIEKRLPSKSIGRKASPKLQPSSKPQNSKFGKFGQQTDGGKSSKPVPALPSQTRSAPHKQTTEQSFSDSDSFDDADFHDENDQPIYANEDDLSGPPPLPEKGPERKKPLPKPDAGAVRHGPKRPDAGPRTRKTAENQGLPSKGMVATTDPSLQQRKTTGAEIGTENGTDFGSELNARLKANRNARPVSPRGPAKPAEITKPKLPTRNNVTSTPQPTQSSDTNDASNLKALRNRFENLNT